MPGFKDNSLERKLPKEVPQLSTVTGISRDFRNEYVGLYSFYHDLGGIDAVRAELREMKQLKRSMKKYEERFPSAVYGNVKNIQNESVVTRINELVDTFNQKVQDPDSLSAEDFLSMYNEFELLILGKKEP
ncbi:MAG: hypothetical protein Q8Q13_02040 [bacterium]|nr:hypothetical protein [bacterium]